MQTHGSKKEVAEMVSQHAASLPGMPAHQDGWLAVVFVGQVSARRYMVGTGYIHADQAVMGAPMTLPHMNDFIGTPTIAAIR